MRKDSGATPLLQFLRDRIRARSSGSRGLQAQERCHPAGLRSLSPVGVQTNRSAPRAPFRTTYPIYWDASLDRSNLQFGAKIKTRRAARLHPQGPQDLSSHLVAHPADRRAKVYGQGPGVSPEAALDRRDGKLEDPGGDAPPTRMQKRNATAPDIDDEHGNAIGSGNSKQHSRYRGHETIRLANHEHSTAGRRIHLQNAGPVHLARDRGGMHPRGEGKTLIATCDIPGSPARRETEVGLRATAPCVGYGGNSGHDSRPDSFPFREPVARGAIARRRRTRQTSQWPSSTRSMFPPRARRRSSIRSYPRSI